MALLQALLAALMRSLGSILNTTFGWATLMLFGRVPKSRQVSLAVVSLGSVLWMIAALGAIHPPLASFLVLFITIPDTARGWMRLILSILALAIPLVVGALSMRLHGGRTATRPALETARGLLRGYPYTLGFALTLVILLLLVPLARLTDAVRGWSTTHIPVIVQAKDYERVVETLQEALRASGMPTTSGAASWVLRFPTRILAFFAGRSLEGLVAARMKALRAEGLEILLHPSDLVVRGLPDRTARASAILIEKLIFTKAHLTWDKEGNDLEDRLQSILHEATSAAARDGSGSSRALGDAARSALASASRGLRAVERDLRNSGLPYEELEKVFRMKLQVETEVLRAAGAAMV